MRVDGIPNVRTCQVTVGEGMTVERQDAGAFYGSALQKSLELSSGLLPVGFYYKWFTRPSFVSQLFLKNLRKLAGVGRLPAPEAVASFATATNAAAAPDSEASRPEPQRNPGNDLRHYDRVVVGAGLSGLQAATGRSGRVLVIDDHARPGGQRRLPLQTVAAEKSAHIERFPALVRAHRRLAQAVADFEQCGGIELRYGYRVMAGYAPDRLVIGDGNALQTLSCSHLTWAAGCLDTMGLFPGNDLPGLIGPRALYRLICRDGLEVSGRQALVVGGGFDFWLAATLLHARGARVSLLLTESGWQSEVAAAIDLSWQLNSGLELGSVRRNGRGGLTVACEVAQGKPAGLRSRIELGCDLVVVCRRGKPVYDIPYQLGADLQHYPEMGGYLPAGTQRGRFTGTTADGLTLELRGEAAGAAPTEVLAPQLEVENG